jgi:hypothetical protein
VVLVKGALLLLAVAALPIAAARLRPQVERCAMDGVEVMPAFRVRVEEADGGVRAFCGVRCAHSWIGHRGVPPRAVLVTDGPSGREIDARAAWFVRTLANRSGGAPDGIRVFAAREDAIRHAEAHGGVVLSGPDRPFAGEGEAREDR